MPVPPVIQGANCTTSKFTYASQAPSNYTSSQLPLSTRQLNPAPCAPPGSAHARPRGLLAHSLHGAVPGVVAGYFTKGSEGAPPAAQGASRALREGTRAPRMASMEAQCTCAALPPPQAMTGVRQGTTVLSSSRAGPPPTEWQRARSSSPPSVLYNHLHPLTRVHDTASVAPTVPASNLPQPGQEALFDANLQASMRHTNPPSIYLRDGWPLAAPLPLSASTRLTHDSGYAGTAHTDTLGLEHAWPSRSPLVTRLEGHADAQAAAEAQYAARMLSVDDPPRSRVNARLRRLSPPAITLRPRTPPPPGAVPATFTDDRLRDDVSIMNYPPASARPQELVREQPLLLLNGPVISGVNVPAPPSLRMPFPARRTSQASVQSQEQVRGWVQMHAGPSALHEHSPQEPPPLVHRCAELPPLTAPPPYQEEDLAMDDESSEDVLSAIRSRWPFAPPTLTSQTEADPPAQTLNANTQLATPDISAVEPPPAPEASSAAGNVPMAVDSPADGEALSSLQLRFERPPYEEWEELATRCARAVGDMRWVLGSCKELALHETNAVTKALVGAVLAVRAAFADAPDDMSVLEQEGCHEWGVKYELLLVSCCRNIDLLTLQAEHVRDRPPRIHKLSGLLDKLWRYVEKFEDLERKLRIVHDHIRMLDLHIRLRHSCEHAAADVSAERARRRAFSDVQNQARDHRREARAEVRRLREETRARRDVRIERKLSRAEALGEACAV